VKVVHQRDEAVIVTPTTGGGAQAAHLLVGDVVKVELDLQLLEPAS
jgi:hypothetical protein